MNPLRTLIVDDEAIARRRIRDLLEPDREIEVIGECGFGADAVEALRRDAPDLVFLDIRLPDLDGFEVLERVGEADRPMVIFVTAWDEHAVRAFDVRATDYLVKPFERERLFSAVGRAKRQYQQSRGVVRRPPAAGSAVVGGRIAVRTDGRVLRLRLDEIDWIEADRDASRFHLRGGSVILVRESLASLEGRLPETLFLRVHRSHIVHVGRVREVQPWFQGDYVLLLEDGTKVVTGRTYRDRIQPLMR